MIEKYKNNKAKINAIIGIILLIFLVIGAAYAYFALNVTNSATETSSTGSVGEDGQVIFTTNTTDLYLNLDGMSMSAANIGTTYYATTDPTGTPITDATLGNGIYTLATITPSDGVAGYDCTYNYDITGSITTPVSDGSDEDIKIIIKGDSLLKGEKVFTLKQILEGGQTLTGVFENVTGGVNQTITIESIVENTAKPQNDFAGNSYSIKLTPKAGADGFSCGAAKNYLAKKLINEGAMWQSGLEGDGYRFVGTGPCLYNNGTIVRLLNADGTCPILYNYTRTTISSGATTNYTYQSSCPSDTSTYTYSCTEANAENTDAAPDNFICFGTDAAAACKANEGKYLYRIMGVFEDESGYNHVKLIKHKQLGPYAWHSDQTIDVSWENSDLYNGLNGSYFLTNASFDYMQDDTWSNKITNWTWSSVNTDNHISSSTKFSFSGGTGKDAYLYEHNKIGKTNDHGYWTTVSGKIGLMYISDYFLSLGADSLTYVTYSNKATFKTGWIHQSNNDTSKQEDEHFMSRSGISGTSYYLTYLDIDGSTPSNEVIRGSKGVRPVFYLNSDVVYKSGTGSYTDPFIIEL